MEVQLQEDDLLAWQDAVARYARGELAPRCAQSEVAMSPSSVREVTHGLIELGVLNLGPEPAGGLWDNDRDPLQRRLAVSTLQALAQYTAGVAYQVHVQALAAWLDRCAGVTPDGVTLVALLGSQGLGRDAVVQALSGRPLSAAQRALMADNWAWPTEQAPRCLHALPDWQAVWLPVWDEGKGWQWHRVQRDALKVETRPHSHGLDELRTQLVWCEAAEAFEGGRSTPALTGSGAHAAWRAVQAMHTVGLQAMAHAVVEGAWARAQDYAQLRRQGGQPIVGHVAVQQLLGRARSAVDESAQVLARLGVAGASGVPWPDLPSRWRDRARCQLSLSAGASATLQVFGGMGYMRDNAMEKSLRDVNHLRLLGGSPAELTLCVGHWDAYLADCTDVLGGEAA